MEEVAQRNSNSFGSAEISTERGNKLEKKVIDKKGWGVGEEEQRNLSVESEKISQNYEGGV